MGSNRYKPNQSDLMDHNCQGSVTHLAVDNTAKQAPNETAAAAATRALKAYLRHHTQRSAERI